MDLRTSAHTGRKTVLVILCLLVLMLCAQYDKALSEEMTAEDSAVVLMYHRFGEERLPSTNIRLDQFEAHLEELKQQKYNIVPLSVIVDAFRSGTKLPPRTLAITIDDAYLSIYTEAWPRLREAGFPFTIFVATEPVDLELKGYMTWDQIREMEKDPLVSIGHHGHSHTHLLRISPEDARRDLEIASERYRRELGYVPNILAYPYGEYDKNIRKIAREMGFRAAFGQHSSAANSNYDRYALPRFAFNEKYAGIGRFRLIANARALPVKDILPQEPLITSPNPPLVGFTVEPSVTGLAAMSCFPSHLGKAARLERIGGNRVEIRFDKPFPPGRSRINCTMPGPDGRWYWFGMPFFVPGGTEPGA
ncbi:polysaccharide deacetylase family protein [Luteithermobacter gelatinilyticus]|uniref:polysaccharide deacetylase family protein n=1 Tax=Luteithermobacter gelatinilyticus TaxID=2582913 RepID=UPI00143D846D|nr:polysaccharide deacetylase family protein [Luteithermobacter gelatinilyticus]